MRLHARFSRSTRVQCLDDHRMRRHAELARVLDGMPQTEFIQLVEMQPAILLYEPDVMEVTVSSLAESFGIKRSQMPSVVSPVRQGDPAILLQPDIAKENFMGLIRVLECGRSEVLNLVSRSPSLLAITEESLISKISCLSQLLADKSEDDVCDWRILRESILRRPEILSIGKERIRGWLDRLVASLTGLLPLTSCSCLSHMVRSIVLSKPALLDEEVDEIMSRLEHIMEASGQGIEAVLGIGSDRLSEVLSRPTSSILIWVDRAAVMINAKSNWIGSEKGSSRRNALHQIKDDSSLYRMILARPSLLSHSVALIAGKRRTLESMCDLLATCMSCSREESLHLISNLAIELMADVLVSSYRPLIKLKYLLVIRAKETTLRCGDQEEQKAWFEDRVRAALHLSDVAFEQEYPQYKAWLKEQ